MFFIIFLLFFLNFCNFANNQSLNFDLVQEITEKDWIHRLTVFHCSDDITSLTGNLMKKYRSVEIFHLDKNFDAPRKTSMEMNLIIILDLTCSGAARILQEGSDNKLFDKKTKWLLFSNDFQESFGLVKQLDVNVDARILLIVKKYKFSKDFQIFHLRAPALKRNGIIYVNFVGFYTPRKGVILDDPFVAVNYTLDGIVMKVGFSLNVVPKGVSFLEFATKHIISNANSLSRAPYQVLLLISQKYNFRMHLKRTPQYGKLVDNNTRWTGLLGYMQRKEVDFASQSFVFALKRMAVMDSGFSATKYRHFFVFRHPDSHVNVKNPFLRPLDDVVWLLIFLVSLVTVFALVMIKNSEREFMENKESLEISILNVIGILALQGLCSDIWSSMRAKMILMLSLLFSFILYQLYSGAVVGSLLAPPPRTITTIEKLTESGMKIVMEETASNRVIFGASFGKDLMDLYEKRVKDQEIYVSMTDGLKMMRDTRIVFLTNVDESYGLIKDLFSHAKQEELQEIPFFPQETIRAALYIPIQKKSPFSEVIRVGVLRLAEIGIKPHVVKQWELKLRKSDKSSNVLKEIDIEQTKSAFFLLLIGHLSCMLLVFLESFMSKICNCLTRQRTFLIDILL